MKRRIYITKSKVWFDDKPVEWQGDSLVDIFREEKEKNDGADTRIVLGNDVCYLVSFPESKVGSLTRESILTETRNHVPISAEDDCFDWKRVDLEGKKWIQAVVVEKGFLESVSKAVRESGMRVSKMTPIGVLLGQRSIWKEKAVMIKWAGQEKLTVLAVRGLVDSVFAETADEEIINYAKNRWGMTEAPETLVLDETNMDLEKEVFSEKNRGLDETILNIPVSEDLEPAEVQVGIVGGDGVVGGRKAKMGKLRLAIAILLAVLILGTGFVLVKNAASRKGTDTQKQTTAVSPTPSPTETPAAINFAEYTVQVLNGSGVAGLAAQTREQLLEKGFTDIDIGNTPETTESVIQTKRGVPAGVSALIRESLTDYRLSDGEVLPESGTYDVVVILGNLQ